MGAGVREEMGMMLGHNRKMLGAECMADMLEAYGVTHVFHVPAVLRKTFAVMETRTKIKRLHVHSGAPPPGGAPRAFMGGGSAPRLRQARHLHGAGDRRAQSRGGSARRLAGAF